MPRVWVSLSLLALVVAVYHPVTEFGFVNYDDPQYVVDNGMVRSGLSAQSLKFAWSTTFQGNWHPLVWMSYLVDAELHGQRAAGFHLTNLLWHAGAVVLLYLALERMTGARWRSALVAALFAIHPLHVESVAWVSERKGLLCTFFWMAAMYAYAWYAQRPSLGKFAVVTLCLLLGLMSKTMIVTLPAILLLLDYWPLRRMSGEIETESELHVPKKKRKSEPEIAAADTARETAPLSKLLLEKAPLAALSLLFAVIVFFTQQEHGAVGPVAEVSLPERFARVGVVPWLYLKNAIWPLALSPNYAAPESISVPLVLAGWGGLLLVTIGAIAVRRRLPYLTVGWLWYLVALLPISGIVPIGVQWMADRYTDLPLVGIYLAVVWGGAAMLRGKSATPQRATLWQATAAVLLLLLAWQTRQQLGYWRDSTSLFEHAVQVEPGNAVAHRTLGAAYGNAGELVKAADQLRLAVEHKPDYALAFADLGWVLTRQGRLSEAIANFRQSLDLEPGDAATQYQAGTAYFLQGQNAEAIECFRRSLEIQPGQAQVHNDLGLALAANGDESSAQEEFATACQINPELGPAHGNLAQALVNAGEVAQAVPHFEQSLRLQPDWVKPRWQLAWVLATCADVRVRDPRVALGVLRDARPQQRIEAARLLDAEAAALAQLGQYAEAAQVATKAAEFIDQEGAHEHGENFHDEVLRRAEIYRRQQTYVAEPHFPW